MSTRQRAIASTIVALALVLAGCSSPEEEPTAPTTASALDTRTPDAAALADRDAYLAGTPEPLDPAWFGHGDFVGAIDIQYLSDRSSDDVRAADSKYNQFYGGTYQPPSPGDRHVVRLTAFEDPRDGARLLMYGAVIDNITSPAELVIGVHNVLEIEGGVELNGEVFEGRIGGAAGAMAVGDRLTIWTPDPNYEDMVNRYDFEVVPAEDGSAYTLIDTDNGAEEYIYRASPSPDVVQLTSYTCWPPNQLDQRMVTRLQLVSSAIAVGSVSPVDAGEAAT